MKRGIVTLGAIALFVGALLMINRNEPARVTEERMKAEAEAQHRHTGSVSHPAAPSRVPNRRWRPALSQAKALIAPPALSAARTSNSDPSVMRQSRMQPSS